MYRLVSQANNFEVLLEGTSFDIEIYLNFTSKKKNELFPFSCAIYNFISAFWELNLFTHIYV